MKKIVLLPVKNESWILRHTLHNFSSFADAIIIADQNSTDGSLEIYKGFPKVTVINNPTEGHSNTARWMLLDECRKMYGTENIIFCIDADEMISAKTAERITAAAQPGASFELPWIQLWKSIDAYRTDSVWADNFKGVAFYDDGIVDYDRTFALNDHVGRIPQTKNMTRLDHDPLLHFQWIAWDATQIKQAWYRCTELIAKKRSAQAINHAYSVSMDGPHVRLEKTPAEWISNIPEAAQVKPESDVASSWHYKQILAWFDQYGVEFFEPLQIWHIPQFRDIFVQKTNRQPQPQTYSAFLIMANKFRHAMKRLMGI